jgi:hypothetical protein
MLQNRIAIIALCFAFFAGIGTTSIFASESQQSDQPQITWKTFKDRTNLFSVQHPSNWAPSGAAEAVGPIDIIFFAPIPASGKKAQIEFIQYPQPSLFKTSKEALESEINTLQNDPTVTKFEIERPVECQTYTLNGLPACSVIYEINSTEGGSLAVMIVDALASNGTEYEVYYHASFDLFEHFLPTVKNMVESFQVTGSDSATTDFSLRDGSFSLNDTTTSDFSPRNESLFLNDTTTSTNITGDPPSTNSSNDDNFSLN